MGERCVNLCAESKWHRNRRNLCHLAYAGLCKGKINALGLPTMATSETDPASMHTALDRIEAALDRIAHATHRATQARLDAAGQTAQLEARHAALRDKVGDALINLDGLIARVEKTQAGKGDAGEAQA